MIRGWVRAGDRFLVKGRTSGIRGVSSGRPNIQHVSIKTIVYPDCESSYEEDMQVLKHIVSCQKKKK